MKPIKYSADNFGANFTTAAPQISSLSVSRGGGMSPMGVGVDAANNKPFNLSVSFNVYANPEALTNNKQPVGSIQKNFSISEAEATGDLFALAEKLSLPLAVEPVPAP